MTLAYPSACTEPAVADDVDIAARIFAPLGVDELRRRYWGQQPLYLPGFAGKFDFLFDEARFHAAVQRCHAKPKPPGRFRLRALERNDESGLLLGRELAPAEMDAALAAGATLCVNDISAGDDDLAFCADELRRAIGHAGTTRFNCYRSRHGGGASLHFDRRVACTLQIAGAKRWRYSQRVALQWPRSNAQTDPRGRVHYIGLGGLEPWEQLTPVQESELEEVLLSPGDLLCLPAGTWHETCSEGDSLALNLSSGPLPFADVAQLALQTALDREPGWRSVPAIGRVEAGEDWPPEALSYCRQRLQEATDLLQALQRDPRPLLRAWSILGRF